MFLDRSYIILLKIYFLIEEILFGDEDLDSKPTQSFPCRHRVTYRPFCNHPQKIQRPLWANTLHRVVSVRTDSVPTTPSKADDLRWPTFGTVFVSMRRRFGGFSYDPFDYRRHMRSRLTRLRHPYRPRPTTTSFGKDDVLRRLVRVGLGPPFKKGGCHRVVVGDDRFVVTF